MMLKAAPGDRVEPRRIDRSHTALRDDDETEAAAEVFINNVQHTQDQPVELHRVSLFVGGSLR